MDKFDLELYVKNLKDAELDLECMCLDCGKGDEELKVIYKEILGILDKAIKYLPNIEYKSS